MAMYVINSHGFPVGMYYSSFLDAYHQAMGCIENAEHILASGNFKNIKRNSARQVYVDRIKHFHECIEKLLQEQKEYLATRPIKDEYDEECFQWDYKNVERYWADHPDHDFFGTRESLERIRKYEAANNRSPFEVIRNRITMKRKELISEKSENYKRLITTKKYFSGGIKHGTTDTRSNYKGSK
jgi:hypothetical protein